MSEKESDKKISNTKERIEQGLLGLAPLYIAVDLQTTEDEEVKSVVFTNDKAFLEYIQNYTYYKHETWYNPKSIEAKP